MPTRARARSASRRSAAARNYGVFIEKDREAVEVIKANLASLDIKSRGRIIRGAAALHLASLEADIVFLDPPYPKDTEYQTALDVLSAKAAIAHRCAARGPLLQFPMSTKRWSGRALSGRAITL